MHLKRQGQYICRTLSYHGCTFQVDEQAVDSAALKVYDDAAELWISLHQQLVDNLAKGSLDYFRRSKPPKSRAKKPRRGKKTSSDSESSGDDLSENDEDSDSDDSDSSGDSLLEDDEKASLKLPAKESLAIMAIYRYFWGKTECCAGRFFCYSAELS